MTKVYVLNEPKNNATFILIGEGGNQVRYTFSNGNAAAHVPASCVLNNAYYQELLETSEIFKTNIVKIDPTFKFVEPKEEKKAALTKVEDVKSVAQAVEWCAEKFGEQVKTAKQAKELAQKNGYDFVNLKIKE